MNRDGRIIITLTIPAFKFVVGVIVVILAIAAEGVIVFSLIDTAVAIAVMVAIVRVLSPKKEKNSRATFNVWLLYLRLPYKDLVLNVEMN